MSHTNGDKILYLFNSLQNGYEAEIWSRLHWRLKDSSFQLLSCSLAGLKEGKGDKEFRSFLKGLIEAAVPNGIIISAGTIEGKIEGNRSEAGNENIMEEFIRELTSIPVVTMGQTFPGISGVAINNSMGLSILLEHLVKHHHYKEIAFVMGPEKNREAKARLATYLVTLQQLGIDVDHGLIVSGNFFYGGGLAAVETLLDKRRRSFQAIVCANDAMALGAADELRRRGLSSVGVTGFDNIIQAKSPYYSLTTVDQSMEHYADVVLDLLTDAMSQKKPPEHKLLDTTPIFRSSCGCRVLSSYPVPREAGGELLDRDQVIRKLVLLLESSNDLFRGNIFSEKNNSILEALVVAVEKEDQDIFLLRLRDLEMEWAVQGLQMSFFFSYLRLLFESWSILSPKPELKRGENKLFLNALYSAALNLTRAIVDGSAIRREEKIKEDYRLINSFFNRDFCFPEDSDGTPRSRELLSRLGIQGLYVALSGGKRKNDYLEIFTGISCRFPERTMRRGDSVAARDFFSACYSRGLAEAGFFIMPIFLDHVPLGLCVLEMDNPSGQVFEVFADHVAAALSFDQKVAFSSHALRELEEKIDRKQKELKGRREQLLESAHQAGLGQISSFMVQNIKNIVDSAHSSLESIMEILENSRLKSFRKGNELLRKNLSGLEGYLKVDPKGKLLPPFYFELEKALESEQIRLDVECRQIVKHFDKIHFIINEQDKLSRGDFYKSTVNLLEVIEEALQLEAENLKKNRINVIRDFKNSVSGMVSGQRNKLLLVFITLIEFAVRSLQSSSVERRCLSIELAGHRQRLVVRMTDNGSGIRSEELHGIFEYHHRGGQRGLGAGLHSCANFMAEIGAEIDLRSRGVGLGSTFTLVFKVKE